MRLLLAEDDPKLLKSLKRIFETNKFSVDVVNDTSIIFIIPIPPTRREMAAISARSKDIVLVTSFIVSSTSDWLLTRDGTHPWNRYPQGGLRQEKAHHAPFLCEACILSVLGGIIGLLLSFGTVEIYSLISATSAEMNWGIGIAAIAFCAVIGILFGGYPAAKASRLQPIDALHTL